jgi:hypothetical protein
VKLLICNPTLLCKNEKLCSPFAAMTGVVTIFFTNKKILKHNAILLRPQNYFNLTLEHNAISVQSVIRDRQSGQKK